MWWFQGWTVQLKDFCFWRVILSGFKRKLWKLSFWRSIFICLQVRKQSSLKCKVDSLPCYLALVVLAVVRSQLSISTACPSLCSYRGGWALSDRPFCLLDKKNLFLKQTLKVQHPTSQKTTDRRRWMIRFWRTVNSKSGSLNSTRGALRDLAQINLTLRLQHPAETEVSAVARICSGGGRNMAAVSEGGTNSSLSVLIIYTDQIRHRSWELAGGVLFFFLPPDLVLSSSFRKVKLHWCYLPPRGALRDLVGAHPSTPPLIKHRPHFYTARLHYLDPN